MKQLRRLWTLEQRRVLVGLLGIVLAYLIVRLILNPVYVSNPQPHTPPRASELEDRIDPNTADIATLATLPQIGQKRARDIVSYRQQYESDHPGTPAFRKSTDLLRIRGIGPAMLEQIEPFLVFPHAPATTRTS